MRRRHRWGYDRGWRERDQLWDALSAIRQRTFGEVCPEYEICTHRACQASYTAWAMADQALRAIASEDK